MTLDDLADKSGISKPFLSQIETGARSYTAKTIMQIADALDLGVADLFDDATEQRDTNLDLLREAWDKLDAAKRKQLYEYALFLHLQSQEPRQS